MGEECCAKFLDIVAYTVCIILVIFLFAGGAFFIIDGTNSSEGTTTNSGLDISGQCELIEITNDTMYEWQVLDVESCDSNVTFTVTTETQQDYKINDQETCVTDNDCSEVQLSTSMEESSDPALKYGLASVMILIGCCGICVIVCLCKDPMQ